MAVSPIEQSIIDDAQAPKEVRSDGVEVVSHNLRDQIEADRYIAGKTAARSGLGVKRTRVVPPGAA